MTTERSAEMYKNLREMYASIANIEFLVFLFGKEIALREGYTVHTDGFDAINFYLAQKYSWTPTQIHSMSAQDVSFLLEEEMANWDSRKACQNLSELEKQTKRLYDARGVAYYHLALFGDFIADREGYKELTEMEAIYFYIAQKHSWTTTYVKRLPFEELESLLIEERYGWTIPPDARET